MNAMPPASTPGFAWCPVCRAPLLHLQEVAKNSYGNYWFGHCELCGANAIVYLRLFEDSLLCIGMQTARHLLEIPREFQGEEVSIGDIVDVHYGFSLDKIVEF